MPFLRGLLDFQKTQNIPPQSPNYAALYRNAIPLYATRYMGQKSAPPAHWSREKHGCTVRARNALHLTLSYSILRRRPRHSPWAVLGRIHINSRIRWADKSLKFETESIVVTKLTDYTDLTKAWRSRHLGASKELKGLDQAAMKVILGKQFTDLVEMKAIKIAKSKAPASDDCPLVPIVLHVEKASFYIEKVKLLIATLI